MSAAKTNKALQPTVLPPLRSGKPAAELGRRHQFFLELKMKMKFIIFSTFFGWADSKVKCNTLSFRE